MNFTYRPVPISAKTAVMAVISGLLLGAVLIFATGNHPAVIYAALVRGACGSLFALASSIRWTVPLIFTGTAAAIAFKGGVFNMGVEGQMYVGGLAAAVVGITWQNLPGYLLVPMMLAASMAAGMIWSLPPILAKLYYGSSEVVPCMMLNYIAMYLTDYLVHNVFLAGGNRGATIKTDLIASQGRLARLIPGTSVSTALLIGLAIVLAYQWVIRRTRFGYEFEICGINPRFARYGGINVNRTRIGVILLSGAIAGLGGATEIMGVRYCFESRFVGDFATNGILEAQMLLGCFFAVIAGYYFQSWAAGVLCAVLASILLGWFFIWITMKMKAIELVVGFAINFLVDGLTIYLLRMVFHQTGSFVSPEIPAIPRITVPVLSRIPLVGILFDQQTWIVYFAFFSVVAASVLIYHTAFGLHILSNGANPEAAQAVGIRIGKTRIQCIMIASVLCGLAGSQLSIGFLSMFSEGMTVGKGFIALGALMFSDRKPALVLFITLLFGFAEAIGNQVQLGGTLASELVLMIPYVAVLACVFVRKPVPEQI